MFGRRNSEGRRCKEILDDGVDADVSCSGIEPSPSDVEHSDNFMPNDFPSMPKVVNN